MEGKFYRQLGGVDRESNIELFRIVSTFFVLVVHFTGWFVGGMADPMDTTLDLSFRIGQIVIESLTVVCVNCFLIISGWFGIKFKLRSLLKMYMLLVSIYIPFQIISSIYTGEFSLLHLVDNILVFTRESYFVQCYVMLMLFSPVLNSFFEKYGKRSLALVLLLWFVEAFMGNIRNNVCLGINEGYSLIHFILMYMLARVARLYKDRLLKVKRGVWILCYFVCAILVGIAHLIGFKHAWAYSNPIIIIEAFCLFFPFAYQSFHNRSINWIASSTFAVYIIHTTPPMYSVLVNVDQWMLNNMSYFTYLPCYLLFCVFIFIFSIYYDKLRIKLTTPLSNMIHDKLKNKFNKYLMYE